MHPTAALAGALPVRADGPRVLRPSVGPTRTLLASVRETAGTNAGGGIPDEQAPRNVEPASPVRADPGACADLRRSEHGRSCRASAAGCRYGGYRDSRRELDRVLPPPGIHGQHG